MKGIYKCDGCIVLDPTVEVLTLNKNYKTGITTVIVDMSGKNESPDIKSDTDGAEIEITDVDNPLPSTTTEKAIQAWAENWLQQFKQ